MSIYLNGYVCNSTSNNKINFNAKVQGEKISGDEQATDYGEVMEVVNTAIKNTVNDGEQSFKFQY